MDRQTQFIGIALAAALSLAGCANSRSSKLRESAAPDALDIHAEAPNLLPAMPVAFTGPTRGQAPEAPPNTVLRVAGNSAMPEASGQVAVRIRAHVNGQPILEEELREAMVMRMGDVAAAPEANRQSLFQQLMAKELDRLIERELILQEALTKIKELKRPQLLETLKTEAAKEGDRRLKEVKASTKMATDAEFKAFLQQNGLSAEGLRRQTERNFMMTEYIRNLIFPAVQRISLQQIRDFYDEHPELFSVPDRVKWMDLFVDASRFSDAATARHHAETVAERARAGEDFASLVKQFDHGDSSLRNGEGLGAKPGEIRPTQAEATVLALKAGQVGAVIDMGFGYHVVKVVERDYAGREPYGDKVQAKAKERLRGAIAEREFKRIVEDLKRKATIVVYEK